jgi:hypothetical protein
LDGNHPTVQRLVRLKRKLAAPVPQGNSQEGQIRRYVKTIKQ